MCQLKHAAQAARDEKAMEWDRFVTMNDIVCQQCGNPPPYEEGLSFTRYCIECVPSFAKLEKA